MSITEGTLNYIRNYWNEAEGPALINVRVSGKDTLKSFGCCERFSHSLRSRFSDAPEFERRRRVVEAVRNCFEADLKFLSRREFESNRAPDCVVRLNKIKRFLELNHSFNGEVARLYNIRTEELHSPVNRARQYSLTIEQLRDLR